MPKSARLRARHVSIDQRPSRQPPHCTKCEGRPLRSECEHTAVGRAFLEKQHKKKAKPHHCRRCPGNPLLSECCHTPRGRVFLDAQRNQEAPQLDYLWMNDSPEKRSKPLKMRVESELNVSPIPGTPPRNEEDFIFSSLETPSANGAHPSPANHISSDPSTPSQSSSSTLLGSTISSGGSSVDTPCPKFKKNFAKRLKASMSNPRYGMISGVMRGNMRYVNYRTRKLPQFRQNSVIAARRFLRLIHKLLEKCEDLAAETGCWIFLGAQHVTARGGAFHYVSPRLLREAQPAAEKLANIFSTTASQLLLARRIEALALQEELDAMREDKDATEKTLQAAKAKIAEYERIFGPLVS